MLKASRGFGVVAVALAVGTAFAADFKFSDFRDISALTLNGSTNVASRALRLTDASGDQSASAWYTQKSLVRGGFDTIFTFRMYNDQPDGADGLAFLVQDESTAALGGGGSGMGYGANGAPGITRSIAIEFDTFGFDPETDNHISVQTNGVNENHWEDEFSLGLVQSPVNLHDESAHTARVQYDGSTMNVYIDDLTTPALAVAVDLEDVAGGNILDENGNAWVGFTSATGADFLAENHDIIRWSYAEGSACEECGEASASCRSGKITVKVKHAPVGCLVTVVLDGSSGDVAKTNERGKAKATFKGASAGSHEVRIPACGFSTTVTCD